MFAATVQSSFTIGAMPGTVLELAYLVGEPTVGDQFELAAATRLVTKVDGKRRTRNCLTAEPFPGAPHLLIAVTPALCPEEMERAAYRRISTVRHADHSLDQRHPGAEHLRFGRDDAETAKLLDQIRYHGRTTILHAAPHPDIRSDQASILLDATNETALVILTTRIETCRMDQIAENIIGRKSHTSGCEWRDLNCDLADDVPILCQEFRLLEVVR